ncbi:HNH endonuclease [Anaerococcus sp.]|uniref:HNH endonuclease n=1 Tax=Anaerococcus sp. TaxID=1872515 RepID=UPI002A90B946|nr:HNH endonuclease [Anaerococcus sp.]MDY6127015.1 HNH endonuclease [Anaerococcus sp.]
MTKRKSLSKKTRFEVFKRDAFTCQYCGRSVPDVILEVDHIKPVSKGGDNEMINLITSCRDCNRGKSDREITDNSTVLLQQKELEALQEKRNQLNMMLEWREGLKKLDDDKVNIIKSQFENECECTVKDNGIKQIEKWVKKYPIMTLLEAMDRSISQYDDLEEAFNMIPRIAYYVNNPEKEIDPEIRYASGILNNRLDYYNKSKGLKLLIEASKYVGFTELQDMARTVKNWTEFRRYCEGILDEGEDEQNNN